MFSLLEILSREAVTMINTGKTLAFELHGAYGVAIPYLGDEEPDLLWLQAYQGR
jgi:hypothetical protein